MFSTKHADAFNGAVDGKIDVHFSPSLSASVLKSIMNVELDKLKGLAHSSFTLRHRAYHVLLDTDICLKNEWWHHLDILNRLILQIPNI